MRKAQNFLITLGVVLLVVIVALGTWTFIHRHYTKELIPEAPVVNNIMPAVEQKPTFNKSLYSVTEPTSMWVVANKKRPLQPLSYTPSDLVSVGNGQQMRQEAADALVKLLQAAKSISLIITPLSGYRSYNTQVAVYGNEVKNFGQAVADTESARPGHSEHQTGLAIDVGGGGCGIENCFGETLEGKWLAMHAYEYGFIIRYTAEKQDITGYRAEPWHIRYIGTVLSMEMHNQNTVTLEEFFDLGAAASY